MKRTICLRVAIVIGTAALLLAAGATAAAASARLILSENGTPVAAGDLAADYHLTFYGGCVQASRGEVLSNDRPTDKLAFGSPEESECLEEGFSVSGALKRVSLTSTGVATLVFAPKLVITAPGPCSYTFSKWVGTFPATIETDVEGIATGKLRAHSSSSCSRTQAIEFRAVESGVDNDIFGAEVAG